MANPISDNHFIKHPPRPVPELGIDRDGKTCLGLKPWAHRTIFGLFYLFASIALVQAGALLPEFETHSNFLLEFYRRPTFYSSYISLGKPILYLCLNLLGFTFVNTYVLLAQRRNPFHDRWGNVRTHSLLKVVLVATPPLYLSSIHVLLRGKNDLQGFCLANQPESQT